MRANILLHAGVWLIVAGLFAGTGCRKKEAATAGEPPITGNPTDAPVAIQPKWSPGQRYVMRLESSQSYQLPDFAAMARRARGGENANTASEPNPPVENQFVQEYALIVTNAAEGQRGLEMEILAIELQASRGDQQFISYDSQNKVAPQSGPMVDLLDKVIGARLWFLVGTNNKVLKVEGVEELFARVQSDDAGAGRGGAAQMLRGAYNEEVFKQMIELAGAPPEAVRIGESWTHTQEFGAPMVGKLSVTTTNTLRGWQMHQSNRCARVEFVGGITASGEPAPGPMGARMAISDGTVTGRYWFSPEIGLPLETTVEQKYTITLSGLGGRNRNANAGDTNTPRSLSAPVTQFVTIRLLETTPLP